MNIKFKKLNKTIVKCKKCKRLTNFIKKISIEKRKQNINEKYLTNFGIQSRPYCYGIPLSDLYNMEELCQTK